MSNRLKMFFVEFLKSIPKTGLSSVSNFQYYKRWSQSLNGQHNSMTDEQPWMTFTAIDFIKQHISNADKVFEFGGGGSTLFFINHAVFVATVEHDEQWFSVLRDKISSKKEANWKGIFVPAEKNTAPLNSDIANPNDYASDDNHFKNFNFRNYASSIDQFPDNYFDWVVVDGRARPSCIIHAINKVKTKGYLVLDNSDRKYYLANTKQIINEKYKLLVSRVAPGPYFSFFSKTSIWQKIN
jgi:hypothetical protein